MQALMGTQRHHLPMALSVLVFNFIDSTYEYVQILNIPVVILLPQFSEREKFYCELIVHFKSKSLNFFWVSSLGDVCKWLHLLSCLWWANGNRTRTPNCYFFVSVQRINTTNFVIMELEMKKKLWTHFMYGTNELHSAPVEFGLEK